MSEIQGTNTKTRGHWPLVFFIGAALALSGCASYQHKVNDARRLMSQNPAAAAETFSGLAKQEGGDQLVYLLDYATALQAAGKYRESTEVFLKADEMADYKDYHSVTKVTGSLLFNEGMVQYKGDDYEKLLINAMLAVNFLAQQDLDGALVETRRLNEKLDYYRIEQKKPYEQNSFAVYLSALIWEADRKWDDAYIAFEKAYKLNPQIPYLREDLVRASKRAQRQETFEKWQQEFGLRYEPKWDDKTMGEVVVVFMQGWGPRKGPHPNSPRFPKLFPVYNSTNKARVWVNGDAVSELTQEVYSVERVAIKTLDDAYAALVAKRLAGVVAKEVVADQIRQKNEALGAVAWLAMHMSDQADLRQWSTLPKTFQVARIRLKAGKYTVKIEGLDDSGRPTGEVSDPIEVTVPARRKVFIPWRSYR